MTYNQRLFNAPKLRAIVGVTDDIAEYCTTIADALATYEDATGTEGADDREQARDEAWSAMGDLLSSAAELSRLRDGLYDQVGASADA